MRLTQADKTAGLPAPSVVEEARLHAYDRYLAALLAPHDARGDLVVLAAYLGEISRIPLTVREAAIGEIRLQWWRDALSQPGSRTGNPVADAVCDLAERRGIGRELMLAPVDGFSRELYEDGIRDRRELAVYADETQGSIIRIALTLLDGVGPLAAEASIEPAARALAMTRLALTLPQHLAHGRLPLPPEVVGTGRDPRTLEASAARGAARSLVDELAKEANAALSGFRAGQMHLKRESFAAFLPLALVTPYLAAAVKPSRDVLTELADISPLSRAARLWFADWRKRI